MRSLKLQIHLPVRLSDPPRVWIINMSRHLHMSLLSAVLALVLNATHMQRHLVMHYQETRLTSSGVFSSGAASGSGLSQPRFAPPRTRTAITVDVTTHTEGDTDKSGQDHDRRDDLEAGSEDVYSMSKFDRFVRTRNFC